MRCLTHKLELAVKDALEQTSFDLIDDMLLRLYLVYKNSPMRCRQLEIMTDLRECLLIEDGGMKPVRVSGSRWITQMECNEKKYGVYTNHIASLSLDPSVKSADRAKQRLLSKVD